MVLENGQGVLYQGDHTIESVLITGAENRINIYVYTHKHLKGSEHHPRQVSTLTKYPLSTQSP